MAKAQLLRLKNDAARRDGRAGRADHRPAQPHASPTGTRQPGAGVGKNDAARADIDLVLKGTPGNVQAIYLLAVMEAQSRNYKAADADLERISGYIGRIREPSTSKP